MKALTLFLLTALSARAQTNPLQASSANEPNSSPKLFESQTNQNLSVLLHEEDVRARCIQGRRSICGKILKVLPEGLVIESGYTNLLRYPLTKSWLVPASVTASRATDFIERDEPGSPCSGLVFLTDFPKSRSTKPVRFDYVIIEGYPAGVSTYTSLGTIHRTVRRFSAILTKAVDLTLRADTKIPPPPSEPQ